MKIVFPELNNKIIQEALEKCNDTEAIGANSLEDGVKLLADGEAEAMIAGIDTTTRDIILCCKENLEMTDKFFSSCFVMSKEEKKFILSDAGVCKKPNEEMLYSIVLQTYDTAKIILESEPKIAVLSFSTFGSARDESIDIIKNVIEKIHKTHPEILIDGEMQLDAAMCEEVATKKASNSKIAGHANVLICPDLNSGNILYKGLERLGGWTAAGPILQGFSKIVSDLSRGSTVEDVVEVIKTVEKLGTK